MPFEPAVAAAHVAILAVIEAAHTVVNQGRPQNGVVEHGEGEGRVTEGDGEGVRPAGYLRIEEGNGA